MRPEPVTARLASRKLTMEFRDHPGGTTLRARTDRVDLDLEAADSGDCLAVVVPWNDTRFQYTVKDLARPVTGSLTVDGITYEIEPGTTFAALDRGRGRWPYPRRGTGQPPVASSTATRSGSNLVASGPTEPDRPRTRSG